MYSLPRNLYNIITKACFTLVIITGCNSKSSRTPGIYVYPKHFKVITPFILNGRGIIINTYWGNEKKHHVLCLDNHSPSWIKSSHIEYNSSFVKSKKLSFKTSVADGAAIKGDVGICDSISFEGVIFRNIPFYVMPENSKDNKMDDGVFGIDAMSKGIWKFDFRKDELTFTSDIDSLDEIKQSEIFPATFDQQSIKVSIDFGNNIVRSMAIDLGYNGDMLLPLRDFESINPSKESAVNIEKFSTPASENTVNIVSIFDTVSINHNWFFTIISSNKLVSERVIGLTFFKRFDYVIFDFIHERIYIPKKVW